MMANIIGPQRRAERPGFNTVRSKLTSMTPPPDSENGNDFDLKRAVTDELESRDHVVDYEITESSPEHVLVHVTETAEEGGSREVLYRVQHEPRPDGTDDIHWEYLGPVVDESSG